MNRLYEGNGWTIDLETASLPDGRITTKARGGFADTAHILAFTERGTLLLLREYRPFYQEWIWMLPSGHIDKEKDPLSAAQRELQEETGFKAKSMTFLWKSGTKENLKQTCHIFLAKNLSPSVLKQDEDEMIEVHECTLNEAIEYVLGSGNIHFPSAVALMKYQRELKE